MKIIATTFLFLSVCLKTHAQTGNCSVVLNHFYTTVDSTTYQAILNSEILHSDFAFAYERNKNWQGLYIIGQDSYIEIFHPNSIPNEHLPIGFTWICQASLVANCTEKYDIPNNDLIHYSSDENFDQLSLSTHDSSELFTTLEMNKEQYESWTKKTFHDSVNFLTVDYNSPSESDSSKHYLFNNITGIQVNVNSRDSLNVMQYLKLIGYTIESTDQNSLKFTNSSDFIELHFSEDAELATISTIHFKLNRQVEAKRISVGNSEIVMGGNTGIWKINESSLTQPIKN